MSKCCIFAGQGAQIPGMGKDFAEADAEVMGFFEKAKIPSAGVVATPIRSKLCVCVASAFSTVF